MEDNKISDIKKNVKNAKKELKLAKIKHVCAKFGMTATFAFLGLVVAAGLSAGGAVIAGATIASGYIGKKIMDKISRYPMAKEEAILYHNLAEQEYELAVELSRDRREKSIERRTALRAEIEQEKRVLATLKDRSRLPLGQHVPENGKLKLDDRRFEKGKDASN